jgi:hypothetical protein
MSGDYSRQRFDSRSDFSGVLMQQGRVQLDADWNEWADILDRRLRAETADLVSSGPDPDIQAVAVYSRLTPDAFRITAQGGALSIGRGRMYVDGLLAENHGSGDVEFDRLLAELRGADAMPYTAQPYHPRPAALPEAGRALAYLDVWQREVGHLERPDLVEIAVGVDTTTRTQTVWQVRVLPGVDAAVACDTPDAQIEGWAALIRPSAGRLSTRAVGVAAEDDPCELPPAGGFRGLENQLYRIEIHGGGGVGEAIFKWSRDNGTVASGVAEVLSAHQLRLDTLGRDSVLRFNTGDWVEVLDDWRELSGLDGDPARRCGEMRQITVDEATQTISFTPDLPADLVPSGAGGDTIGARHLRVRRWDQRGTVLDADGNVYFDLNDTSTSHGAIPVPPPGTSVVLEAGIEVSFSLSGQDGPDGTFHSGDYWVFAARTANASVEELDAAPPRGPHHHFARLAIVTFPDTTTDCRAAWPPEASGGDTCDCTVCVSVEEFETDPDAIQKAVDQVRESGGTICLGVGTYVLRAPVRIEGARSIRIRGQGASTEVVAPGAVFAVTECAGIAFEEMTLAGLGKDDEPVIAAAQVLGLRLERLHVTRKGDARAQPAIGLARVVTAFTLRSASLDAPTGLGVWAREGEDAYLSLRDARIEDNAFEVLVRAVDFSGKVIHGGVTRVEGNNVHGAREGGFVLTGAMLDEFGIDIARNTLQVLGDGVVGGVSGLRIEANEIVPSDKGAGGRGIAIQPGFAGADLDRCMILENRISGVSGNAISIEGQLRSLLVKDNVLHDTGGGIVFSEKGAADAISIENNQLFDIAATQNEERSASLGIAVFRARALDVAGNAVRGVGAGNVQGFTRAGILAVACESVRVRNNEVTHVGPPGQFVGAAWGIGVMRPFQDVAVTSNAVSREMAEDGVRSGWSAIVAGAGEAALAGGALRRISAGAFMLHLDDARDLLVTGAAATAVPAGLEDAVIEGNTVDAGGGAPAMAVAVKGECRVSDNRCTQRTDAPGLRVQAAQAIASTNRVRGGQPAMSLEVDTRRSTILGNVTSTAIEVPGGLQAPWDALNVVA